MSEPPEPVDYTERLIETMHIAYPGLPLSGADPDYGRLDADFGAGSEVCTPGDYDWIADNTIDRADGRTLIKRGGYVVGWYEKDGTPFVLDPDAP